jgi:hypothetical protein
VGGAGGGAPQTPMVDPWDVKHGSPAQQSALTLQAPPGGLQAAWQASFPSGPATQCAPLQQSPSKAQAAPPPAQASRAWHRGTPSASSWQAPEFPGAPQQSLRADEFAHA